MQIVTEDVLRAAIAANLVRLRTERGYSQEELALKAGISRISMNRTERGHSTPGADVLYALADALGVSADALRQVSEKIEPKSG
ncbi:helix-turn-helix transcriptional regulator [bacterium]|nr:helix-turn-helix transcriptional regulator [bacterium]